MDDHRFDELIRTLAQGGWSRRHASRSLAGGALALLAVVGAHSAEARKRKKKKKKKSQPAPQAPLSPPATQGPAGPSGCTPDCAGKGCGDADGCGGLCTACPSGKTCQNQQCVDDTCTPTCTGNHLCQNGSCVCAPGFKECGGPGFFGLCHECCHPDDFFPDPDCAGSLNGNFCTDVDGDLVLTCSCFARQENCGDGKCVECCTHQKCQSTYEDEFRVCIGGVCRCDEAAGFILCPDGPARNFCRHVADDAKACGPQCVDCGLVAHGWQCENGTCCLGRGHACVPDSCCSGLACVDIGTPGAPQLVCSSSP
jgi:hypothetical protein